MTKRQNLWWPKYANCLIWTLGQKLLYGGKVCVNWKGSQLYGVWVPHFKWYKDGRTYGYYPSSRACRGRKLNTHLLFHGVPFDITGASND